MMEDLKIKGSILKQTRESQGLSLEAVHENTKIPLDVLRALEEGYTVRTISPFYQKGFLKLYAKHLNLDWKEIVGESPAPPSDSLKEPAPDPVLKVSAPVKKVPLPPVPGIQVWERFRGLFAQERCIQLGKFLGGVLIVFVLWKVTGWAVHAGHVRHQTSRSVKPAKTQMEAAKKPPATLKETKTLLPEEPPASSESVAALMASKVPPPGAVSAPEGGNPSAQERAKKNVILSIRAKRNGWLLVKADGQVVFQAVFKKGVTKTWFAEKEIELSGKNINQLEFEVNGKMIGVLGKEGHRAKRVVITKNGLSVKK